MTRLPSAIALGVSVLLLLPTSAIAGAKVDPGKKGSSVVLKAKRVHKHHSPTVGGHGGPATEPLKFHCFADQLEPGTRCALRTFPPGVPARPTLAQGDILEAVKEIGLPSLTIRIQPGTATLVNIRTIFYAKPKPFKRNVNLLGYDIDLVAKPIKYRWFHGDGTSATSTRPGKAYPSMDVTYRYRRPAKSVRPRVDVTYRVKYRVDGGEWLTLDQTLVAQGPTAGLQVKEAAPVLTKP